MILTEYEPTPWTITLTLEIILITIRIYWTQEIDPRQNGSSNDTTERNSNSLINLARNLSILTDETKLTPLEIRAISCETNLIVKDKIDEGQNSGIINRIILWNGCIVLLWRIDST